MGKRLGDRPNRRFMNDLTNDHLIAIIDATRPMQDRDGDQPYVFPDSLELRRLAIEALAGQIAMRWSVQRDGKVKT